MSLLMVYFVVVVVVDVAVDDVVVVDLAVDDAAVVDVADLVDPVESYKDQKESHSIE
jgi:hypothetical protein